MKYKINNSASEIILFIEKKNTKIQIIFDAENWLWMSNWQNTNISLEPSIRDWVLRNENYAVIISSSSLDWIIKLEKDITF